MTNRQWLMWQMIDMSDEELIKNFGSMCDACRKYITPNKVCPKDCDSLLLAWLKKEHKEGEGMSIEEHLIENALVALEGDRMDDFFKNKLYQDMAKGVGISLEAVWKMATYVTYTWVPACLEEERR